MFFFLRFEFLSRKMHLFLHPRFSFITMFLSKKIFLRVLFVFRMLFRFLFTFLFIRSIILIFIISMFIPTFSSSIRDRYTIWIINMLIVFNRFRRFFNTSMFLLLLFLRRSSSFISL